MHCGICALETGIVFDPLLCSAKSLLHVILQVLISTLRDLPWPEVKLVLSFTVSFNLGS